MKLIDILTAQSGTQDLDFHTIGDYYICFKHEGRPWCVNVWECAGRWYIKGGELGEKWECPLELTKEEIKKYQEWCGL